MDNGTTVLCVRLSPVQFDSETKIGGIAQCIIGSSTGRKYIAVVVAGPLGENSNILDFVGDSSTYFSRIGKLK